MPHGEQGDVHEAYAASYTTARSALQLGMMLLTAHFVSRLAAQSRAYERGLAGPAEEARANRELLEQALEERAPLASARPSPHADAVVQGCLRAGGS